MSVRLDTHGPNKRAPALLFLRDTLSKPLRRRRLQLGALLGEAICPRQIVRLTLPAHRHRDPCIVTQRRSNQLEGVSMSAVGLLKDKVVVVTGAGRGIGREVALSAAAEGAKVVVNDLGASLDGDGADQSLAAEVVALIRQAGGEAIANGDSVADAGSAERIVATAVEHYGRIDAVVNNAGILRDAIFHKLSVADFEEVVRVHLFGAFYMSHAAALRFREQNGGALVHMTSTSGLIGSIGQANYAAAKMGIVGLSRSIAMDMQRFNVAPIASRRARSVE